MEGTGEDSEGNVLCEIGRVLIHSSFCMQTIFTIQYMGFEIGFLL